jgi:nucleoside-diphosphate-sugar epimerase
MQQKVLVTGATGFVGQYVTRYLRQQGYAVRALARQPSAALSQLENVQVVIVPDMTQCNWAEMLDNITFVIHCAALAHIPNIENQKERLWQVNVEATQQLAQASQKAGVQRFVFLSSIKVLGESTHIEPFSVNDNPFPVDLYGESKWAAERVIQAIPDLNWVIIRPPLLYAPNAKGNLDLVLKALQKGMILPLRSINNKRSFLGLGNLSHFILHCLTHPNAVREILLVSDGIDISTPELIRAIAISQGLRAKLAPCPIWLLSWVASLLGKQDAISKLTQSLQVDMSQSTKTLDWYPPYTLAQGLSDNPHS